MPSKNWLDINLERAGAELQARAWGWRDEQALLPTLGPETNVELLSQFTRKVQEAASNGQPLGVTLRQAQVLYRALFQGELQEVLVRLREAAGDDKLLLRLLLPRDGTLQGCPWEALCEPDSMAGFLGNSTDVLLARGVNTLEPQKPREVQETVRLLAIAPSDEEALTVLRVALDGSIAAGEIEWLPPLVGPGARLPYLFDRLNREPIPHILHFIGHGSVDPAGTPCLRLEDENGEELWLPVEKLAQQLREGFRKHLRLIVLDACEGARPGAFASAAEWLTRSGADAVVAHLWPVKADLARACSRAFYRTLTGADQLLGDVACSLQQARRTVLGAFRDSAEAFSPVLYLRGHESVLFDLRRRKLQPPRSSAPASERPSTDIHSPALHKLLEQPFTLVLGDRWRDERVVLAKFRERLHEALERKVENLPAGLPMSALTQRYVLRFGADDLDAEFQTAFGETAASLPILGTLAGSLVPGFHITLQRLPVLELALAEQQKERTLYIIQPSGKLEERGKVTVLKREGGGKGWEKLTDWSEGFDLSRDIVILRTYCGYMPPLVGHNTSLIYMRPLITEDQYLLGISDLESILPLDLADELKSALNIRPALLLGLSMFTWHHRMLLYRFFGQRPLPRGSLVVLEPGELERELWESGRILTTREGVQVLELSARDLERSLEAMASEPLAASGGT